MIEARDRVFNRVGEIGRVMNLVVGAGRNWNESRRVQIIARGSESVMVLTLGGCRRSKPVLEGTIPGRTGRVLILQVKVDNSRFTSNDHGLCA